MLNPKYPLSSLPSSETANQLLTEQFYRRRRRVTKYADVREFIKKLGGQYCDRVTVLGRLFNYFAVEECSREHGKRHPKDIKCHKRNLQYFCEDCRNYKEELRHQICESYGLDNLPEPDQMMVLEDDDYENMRRRMLEKLFWTEKPILLCKCTLGFTSGEEESNVPDHLNPDYM